MNLIGSVEITVSDGNKRVFNPGSVVLLEDTTGPGHISRAVAGKERLSLFIKLE